MTITVERLSASALESRRADLVRQLGGNEELIRRRAEEYEFTLEEGALFRELEGIDYLLGR